MLLNTLNEIKIGTTVHVVLYRPEIPYNTGNIIRLCANVGAELHLIHPLGFELTESKLRRAALDYSDLAVVTEHENLEDYKKMYPDRIFYATSARSRKYYSEIEFGSKDTYIFGPESSGIPPAVLDTIPRERHLLIPMKPGNRSLNIANAVSIIVYEAWRQNNFENAGPPRTISVAEN